MVTMIMLDVSIFQIFKVSISCVPIFIVLQYQFHCYGTNIIHWIETSLPVFPSCRDCPSYLVSAETVWDLLLLAETAVPDKRLSAETIHVSLLPAETLSRKLLRLSAGSRIKWTAESRFFFLRMIVLEGSTRLQTVKGEAKYDRTASAGKEN